MNRRSFLTGLATTIAAPAIVRAASLMPIKLLRFDDLSPLILPPYGLSPMMQVMLDIQKIEAEMIRMMHVPLEWLTPAGSSLLQRTS